MPRREPKGRMRLSASALQKPPRSRQYIEWMVPLEIVGFQTATDALFEAADTQTAAPTLQPGFLPNLFRYCVDLLVIGQVLLRHRSMDQEGHVNFLPGHKAGRGID